MQAEPIGLLAAAVRRAIQRTVASHVEPLGLSTMQFWILVGIAENPGRCQAELSARARVDEPSLSRVLRGLGARGFVRAARTGGDRRRVHVELTPDGEALARRLLPIARTVRRDVDSALTAAERDALRASLTKILRHLDGHAARPHRAAAPASSRPARKGMP